ncbi:MAG: hypothetical protein ACLFU6_11320, partial [Candidatus Hydrogenedentota bacterium]
INGDLHLDERGAHVRVENGLTLNGTAYLTGSFARMRFVGDQTLHAGTLAFDNSSGSWSRLELRRPCRHHRHGPGHGGQGIGRGRNLDREERG